jgi:hypothetical protein
MVFNTKLRLSRIVGIQICQFFTLLLSHLLIFPTLHVNAIPKRGNEPWSLILCKSGELGWYEPQTREWFEDWLIGTDESGQKIINIHRINESFVI